MNDKPEEKKPLQGKDKPETLEEFIANIVELYSFDGHIDEAKIMQVNITLHRNTFQQRLREHLQAIAQTTIDFMRPEFFDNLKREEIGLILERDRWEAQAKKWLGK